MTEPTHPHDEPLDPSPTPASLATLTSLVLEAARATEVLRLATELHEEGLAVLASAELHAALVAVERAYAPLAGSELAEASALVSHLERRARTALETAAAPRSGRASMVELLDRLRVGRLRVGRRE